MLKQNLGRVRLLPRKGGPAVDLSPAVRQSENGVSRKCVYSLWETRTPLSPIVFDILVTLATGDAHGYAILTDIRERTGETLRPGSLYRALNRLLDERLIETVGAPVAGDDGRRTYYRLSAAGRREAQAEAERLEAQVRTARDARLLKKAR